MGLPAAHGSRTPARTTTSGGPTGDPAASVPAGSRQRTRSETPHHPRTGDGRTSTVVDARPPGPGESPPAGAARAARGLARSALIVAGALALLATFPPYDLWAAGPLGVAALHLAGTGLRARQAALLGLLAGLTLFVPLLSWSGLEVGPVPWLLLAVSQAVWFAPLLAAASLRLPVWPLAVAGLWVASEALRGRLPFGGFTWGRLAFGQTEGPLLGLAALGGPAAVTAAVALLGALLAVVLRAVVLRVVVLRVVVLRAAVRGDVRRRAVPAAAALATAAVALPAVAVLGTGALAPRPERVVTAALVQGGVPRLGLDFNAQRRAVLDNHVRATERLADDVAAGRVPPPDLVVWPENASDVDPYADDAAAAAISAAVADAGRPVLVGAVVGLGPREIANVGLVWDPETGRPGPLGSPGTYVKRHPVPFAERVPLRALARRVSSAVDLVPRDFVRGERVGLLDVGGVPVGDVICFEVAYDHLVRDVVRAGAEVLVVQTNNATFGESPMSAQQLAMGRLRAVEHGRELLSVSTSGISAVVAADGTVRQALRTNTAGTLVAQVGLRSGRTPATVLGVGAELALAAPAVLALAAVAVRPRRGRAAP